jgi:hypothetical protein
MDYNSVFDGDVIIKNCRCGENMTKIIEGRWVRFYNGLDNHVTNSLSVDGLRCDSGEMSLYAIYNADPGSLTDDVNKLYLPKKINLSRIFAADGTTSITPKIAEQEDVFLLENISVETN